MTHCIEATMQEQLWSWLADKGYEVYGEVSISGGRVDLVCTCPEEEEYIGVELKNHDGGVRRHSHPAAADFKTENPPTEAGILANKYSRQVDRYVSGGELDRVYFACQQPSILTEATEYSVGHVGRICVPDPFRSEDPIEITSEAERIPREGTPTLRRDDEPTTQHYLWEEIGGIREAILPNREAGETRRIDILNFTDSIDPTEVYRNQANQDIIGIEVKGAMAVQSDPESIQKQLQTYHNSGGLTRLYLGVPATVEEEAFNLLDSAPGSDLDSVGLYTVSADCTVTKHRGAEKLAMYFDGMRVNTASRHQYLIDVGWGRANSELPNKSEQDYYSIFDTM